MKQLSLFDFGNKFVERYTVDDYHYDLSTLGISGTWDKILSHFANENSSYGSFTIENFGYWYEDALAFLDKQHKKESGKYFTPHDVADLMSEWLEPLTGDNVCDVCCGTGNLIIAFLKRIPAHEAKYLIKHGKVWLYDMDPVAMMICRKSIECIFGEPVSDDRCIVADFLDGSVHLPENCKVISNPPYFKIGDFPSSWEKTDVLKDSREFYSVIMEKILNESGASVIITPYSFIGGRKYYSLRKLMNDHNGFIVSYDNVPGNIFNGTKHGRFNTNNANSVRAAITVTENREGVHGYRISGLVRFKSEERTKALNSDYLEGLIGYSHQIVDGKNFRYAKCFPGLEGVMEAWFDKASETLNDLTDEAGEYKIYVPNTCRYFTVATKRDLQRVGKLELRFKDKETCAYAYCMINSSFCYWYWRLYDGGITYPIDLLYSLPCFYEHLSDPVKTRCVELYDEMSDIESENLSYKKNAGAMQENVHFPDKYRVEINDMFLNALNCKEDSSVFMPVHSNCIGGKQVVYE